MAEELGLDPGPELQATHTAILRDDPEATVVPPSARPAPPPIRPAQLPADLSTFTGRDEELADLLARSGDSTETVVITAIDGMAGIGKTALAVHVAHRLVPDYPDGQLFIDLNGFTEGVDPVTPNEALGRLLRSIGIPDSQIPPDTADRAGLYRSVLADKRVLVLLDNAAAGTQVEPLLPAAAGCLALITSRSRLTAVDQASPLSLDIPPESDAAAMFTRVVGEDRLVNEPSELVERLVRLCGGLPLAIRIAASRLRTRPSWTLSHLVDRLQGEHRRLTELGVSERDVAGVFQLSYRNLPDTERRMFRLLGLHPGYDIDTEAAAALAGCPVPRAGPLLDSLLDVHLLQQHEPGRYRFHDLLRAFAATRARAEEPESDRDAALDRLVDHYTYSASVAMDAVYPDEITRRPRIPEPRPAAVDSRSRPTARWWLDAELTNLLAVAGAAVDRGDAVHVIHLAQTLWRHLHVRGRRGDAETLHLHALDSARDSGDRLAELRAFVGLGKAAHDQGRHGLEHEHYVRALTLARGLGYRVGELDALIGLGRVDQLRGAFGSAVDYYERGHTLACELDDYVGKITALTGLAHIHSLHGRRRQAADRFELGLELTRRAADHLGEIDILNGLARVWIGAGEYSRAASLLQHSLVLAHEVASPAAEVQALSGLGQIHLAHEELDAAAECHQAVLDLARETGDRNYQFEGLNGLGRVRLAAGHAHDALLRQQDALRLARDLEQRLDEAAAHEGIADAQCVLGRTDEAREHWQLALAILTDLGVPDEERVRNSLASLDQDTSPPAHS